MCVSELNKKKNNFYVDKKPQSMRITSKAKSFNNILMKYLKFAIPIPFKFLVLFYILIETIV